MNFCEIMLLGIPFKLKKMNKLPIHVTRSVSLFKRTMPSDTEVLFENLNSAGIITLNRPKAMNAFTINMQCKLMEKLIEWERNRRMVIITGAGGKAFCAGGTLHVAIDKNEGPQLFRIAYQVNNLIYNYRIPYIALIDGITMGGGLGLSVHGRYRVATENTMAAMPEAKVGLFPDVGASYFLPRLEGHLGTYLGLTGAKLKGKDVVKVGIATHYVPSKRLDELKLCLSKCTGDSQIKCMLDKFSEPPGNFSLSDKMKLINHCFGASTVEEIIQRLKKVGNDWSHQTITSLMSMSPTSLKITLKVLQRGARLHLDECLQMEYRISSRAAHSHDFPEGVRALLIDKDNCPRWKPSTLEEVTEELVESCFQKLPENEELKFVTSQL